MLHMKTIHACTQVVPMLWLATMTLRQTQMTTLAHMLLLVTIVTAYA